MVQPSQLTLSIFDPQESNVNTHQNLWPSKVGHSNRLGKSVGSKVGCWQWNIHRSLLSYILFFKPLLNLSVWHYLLTPLTPPLKTLDVTANKHFHHFLPLSLQVSIGKMYETQKTVVETKSKNTLWFVLPSVAQDSGHFCRPPPSTKDERDGPLQERKRWSSAIFSYWMYYSNAWNSSKSFDVH